MRSTKFSAGACLLALVTIPAAEAQVPAGGEFLVTNPPSYGVPNVAVDPTGAFVVVWNQLGQSSSYLKGQRFDRRGARQGAEFQLTSGEDDFNPRVAAFPQGRFAVVWNRSSVGPFARVFDASGLPVSPELSLGHPGEFARDPSIAATSAGSFVVTWTDFESGYPWHDIFARRFDLDGNPLSGEFVVNAYTTEGQYGSWVSAAEDGSFVVVWTSRSPGPELGVFGRRFDAAGQPLGPDFSVNTYTTARNDFARVASDGSGKFVAIWERKVNLPSEPATLVGRRFAATGVPAGPEFVVANFTQTFLVGYPSSVASDEAGNFTITWSGLDDGDDDGVMARRYDRAGVPRGGVFQVNTSTADAQRLGNLASDGAGNLFATWITAPAPPPGDYHILGRRYGGLLPESLFVVDGDNSVVEVGDTFGLLTAWRNVTGAPQTFQGHRSNVVVPAGLTLTLGSDADYGTVADGALGACAASCIAGILSGTRPPGHVDASVIETIVPDAQGQANRWVLHVGESFTDVARSNPFYRFVETLLHRGVTAGCTGATYCPGTSTTREQMSVFVLAAKEGAGYAPPVCTTPVFGDVPASSPFCRWIEELARRGVTSGCGGGNYCPTAPVSREQMAVFVLRTLDPSLNPPACAPPNIFNDVPETSPFCPWIEELARRGITGGCGGGDYCPTAPVTREQMAVFLTGTFGLTLYGP